MFNAALRSNPRLPAAASRPRPGRRTHRTDVASSLSIRASCFDTARPSARPWLFGISTYLLRRHRRQERRQLQAYVRTGIDPIADAFQAVEVRLDAARMGRELASSFTKLSPEELDVLCLCIGSSPTPRSPRRSTSRSGPSGLASRVPEAGFANYLSPSGQVQSASTPRRPRPMMDEIELIRGLRADLPSARAESHEAARVALLQRIESGDRPASRGSATRRRTRRARLLASAASALILATVLPMLLLGGSEGGVQTAAAKALRQVAEVAESQLPPKPPRPGQYLFTRSKVAYLEYSLQEGPGVAARIRREFKHVLHTDRGIEVPSCGTSSPRTARCGLTRRARVR